MASYDAMYSASQINPATLTPAQLQQWQQWQQQYQVWQQQYGKKYEESMKATGEATPPVPTEPHTAAPPLPAEEVKPPLPIGPSTVKADPVKPPLPRADPPEQLSEAEINFDIQFKQWEQQFEDWKKQNVGHPDKVQYRQYEIKWETWREQLLERREQMRKKRIASQPAPLPKEDPPVPLMPSRAPDTPPPKPPPDPYNSEPLVFKKMPDHFVKENEPTMVGPGPGPGEPPQPPQPVAGPPIGWGNFPPDMNPEQCEWAMKQIQMMSANLPPAMPMDARQVLMSQLQIQWCNVPNDMPMDQRFMILNQMMMQFCSCNLQFGNFTPMIPGNMNMRDVPQDDSNQPAFTTDTPRMKPVNMDEIDNDRGRKRRKRRTASRSPDRNNRGGFPGMNMGMGPGPGMPGMPGMGFPAEMGAGMAPGNFMGPNIMPGYMGGPGNFMGQMVPGNMMGMPGNFIGGPNMGMGQMVPNGGSTPNMGQGPNMGPGPNMAPVPNMGMGPNMGPGPNTEIIPNLGSSPNMGFGSNMGTSQNRGPMDNMGPNSGENFNGGAGNMNIAEERFDSRGVGDRRRGGLTRNELACESAGRSPSPFDRNYRPEDRFGQHRRGYGDYSGDIESNMGRGGDRWEGDRDNRSARNNRGPNQRLRPDIDDRHDGIAEANQWEQTGRNRNEIRSLMDMSTEKPGQSRLARGDAPLGRNLGGQFNKNPWEKYERDEYNEDPFGEDEEEAGYTGANSDRTRGFGNEDTYSGNDRFRDFSDDRQFSGRASFDRDFRGPGFGDRFPSSDAGGPHGRNFAGGQGSFGYEEPDVEFDDYRGRRPNVDKYCGPGHNSRDYRGQGRHEDLDERVLGPQHRDFRDSGHLDRRDFRAHDDFRGYNDEDLRGPFPSPREPDHRNLRGPAPGFISSDLDGPGRPDGEKTSLSRQGSGIPGLEHYGKDDEGLEKDEVTPSFEELKAKTNSDPKQLSGFVGSILAKLGVNSAEASAKALEVTKILLSDSNSNSQPAMSLASAEDSSKSPELKAAIHEGPPPNFKPVVYEYPPPEPVEKAPVEMSFEVKDYSHGEFIPKTYDYGHGNGGLDQNPKSSDHDFGFRGRGGRNTYGYDVAQRKSYEYGHGGNENRSFGREGNEKTSFDYGHGGGGSKSFDYGHGGTEKKSFDYDHAGANAKKSFDYGHGTDGGKKLLDYGHGGGGGPQTIDYGHAGRGGEAGGEGGSKDAGSREKSRDARSPSPRSRNGNRSRHDRSPDRRRDRRDRDGRSRGRDDDRDRDRGRDRDRDKEHKERSPKKNSGDVGKAKDGKTEAGGGSGGVASEAGSTGPVAGVAGILVEDLIQPPGRHTRPNKMLFIMRGISASGKSYVTRLIKEKESESGGSAPRILSIDDYFMTDVEIDTKDEDTGQRIKKREMKYEYDSDMDEVYQAALLKACKKTISDGFFLFIIVDAVNKDLKHVEEIWSFAKQKGFQVYICEMDNDVAASLKRNTHNRTEADIQAQAAGWESAPSHYLRLDVRSLLQSEAIDDVEMEDVENEPSQPDDSADKPEEKKTDDDEDEPAISHFLKSKWEEDESSGQKLDRLDGLKKKKPASMEAFLSTDEFDDFIPTERASIPGKKRVRWADMEERQQQEKMRAIGFVVGQTDWKRMMDPTSGESALTRTKYI